MNFAQNFLHHSIRLLILVALSSFCRLESTPTQSSGISQELVHYENNVTELKLNNGMKVVLKKTDFDPGETFIQLVAPGGYSELEKKDRPSGMLSSKIAIESGMTHNSSSEFAYSLYEYGIDLRVSVEKTYRFIDATLPKESIDEVLRISAFILRENKLTADALQTVVEREKSIIRDRHLDPEKNFEMNYFALNTENSKDLRPLSLKGANSVDLEKARALFKQYFSNPEDFILVIVGDFEIDSVKDSILKYFGNLENDSNIKGSYAIKEVEFPNGIVRKNVSSRRSTDAYTRITFPVSVDFTFEGVNTLELTTLLLEKRLRKIITAETGKTFGVDVGYELPLYPYHKTIWLSIQFHSPKNKTEDIEKHILKELAKFQEKPVSQDEFDEIVRHQRYNDDFWLQNNPYWQAKLVNFGLWGWDLSLLRQDNPYLKKLSPQDIQQFLYHFVPLDNYTVITSS
ncbi:MAG: insulinase family protein [Chlamydiota bacterium]|nr:insulinase family protein [Chlamydiota bacterium]